MKLTHILATAALVFLFAAAGARAQDKVVINNNTGSTLVGVFMSLNDIRDGEPDWESNLAHNDPLQPGEQIEVEAFEGEECETYIIGINADGEWWYVEQDTCHDHKVDLAESKKGDGKKHTK